MHFHHVWMCSIETKRFSSFSLHLQTISVRRCVRFLKRAFVNKRLGNVSFRRIYAARLLRGRLFVRGIPGVRRSTLETLDSRKINERGGDTLVYVMFGLDMGHRVTNARCFSIDGRSRYRIYKIWIIKKTFLFFKVSNINIKLWTDTARRDV